jgi:hypothetical protein
MVPLTKLPRNWFAGFFRTKDSEVEAMKKWFSERDVRKSEKILAEVLAFIEANQVKSVVMMEEIIGFPANHGIQYGSGGIFSKLIKC